MKKQIFLWILCISAFLLGMLFGVYVDFSAGGSDRIELHISSGRNSSAEKRTGRENREGILFQTEILDKKRKKDGWGNDRLRIRLCFSIPERKEKSIENIGMDGKNVCAGDYFIYPVPSKYTLGERFSSGEIRKGLHTMARYRRVEKKGKEALIFTITEYAVLYSLYGEVSGHMILDMERRS